MVTISNFPTGIWCRGLTNAANSSFQILSELIDFAGVLSDQMRRRRLKETEEQTKASEHSTESLFQYFFFFFLELNFPKTGASNGNLA